MHSLCAQFHVFYTYSLLSATQCIAEGSTHEKDHIPIHDLQMIRVFQGTQISDIYDLHGLLV